MRNHNIAFLMFFLFPVLLPAQSYYWNNGKKVGLQIDSTKHFVILKKEVSNAQILKRELDTSKLQVRTFKKTKIAGHLNFIDSNSRKTQTWSVIDSKSKRNHSRLNSNKILYQTPFYIQDKGKPFGLSHLFYVKLKNTKQLDSLFDMAKKHRVEVMGNNRFMPLWYTLRCGLKTKGNALDMANIFYENGNFKHVQADFMLAVESTAACDNMNDTKFNDQWNLKNTGQNGGTSGIDINVCDAWDITKGSADIVVAVIEGGVQKTHPDLTNIYKYNYDAESDKNNSQIYDIGHGTSVAGIIGADHNNIGVAGIAPNCPIMPISVEFSGAADIHSPDGSQELANGFSYAWQCGASVICNAYGAYGTAPNANPILENAIENALNFGRCGLGCVVIFASGNYGLYDPITQCPGIHYPANTISEILVVGANANDGTRWFKIKCEIESSYGSELDVVAPGDAIPTTDLTGAAGYKPSDYYMGFTGTSAAAPHAAGVAALMLSKNPCLAQEDVVDIIESTTKKVGGYSYTNTVGRNNGTWNDEMGYGLIDAYSALTNTPTPNPTCSNDPTVYLSNKTYDGVDSEEYGCYLEIEDVENINGAKMDFKFLHEVYIKENFEVELGSEVFIGNCCK